MAGVARPMVGVLGALACVAGALVIHRGVAETGKDEQRVAARNDANRRVAALAEVVRRDLERLLPTVIAAASVQELQEMVRQGADAATFHDFMTSESNWRGFRTAPLSSALYLDRQRLAQTSDTFPEDSALQQLIESAGVQGRGRIIPQDNALTSVVVARLPVVTRGDTPKEAVLALARPLDLSTQDGPWLFSDGQRAVAGKGGPELTQLVGQEKQTPIALEGGTASAIEIQPGLWAWSLAPLPPPGPGGTPAAIIFGAGGLLALVVLVFAFRPGGSEEKELIAETSRALRQSQEQLQRLSLQLDTRAAAGPAELAGTALSLEAPQPSRYEVVAPLGEGGMARVYLAVTRGAEGFKRAFVLKRLRPEIMGTPEAVTQFIDEARLGSSLVHSNIVPVFDFGRDAEGYYLAQEYILGRDLDAVRQASLELRRTPLELPLVFYVAQEALKALAYAHTRTTDSGAALGLVHRDVSPNNLMISAQGELKLLDLGIAKSSLNLTKTQAGMVKGNVFYMSPEQARGEPIDGRADLFSLGLVLFTAAAGDTLYQGTSNYELLTRAGRGLGPNEWDRVGRLPPELSALLKRVLQPDRADRFSSAEEMAAAIPAAAVGPAGAMHALMTQLFAEEFRREQAQFQQPARTA